MSLSHSNSRIEPQTHPPHRVPHFRSAKGVYVCCVVFGVCKRGRLWVTRAAADLLLPRTSGSAEMLVGLGAILAQEHTGCAATARRQYLQRIALSRFQESTTQLLLPH